MAHLHQGTRNRHLADRICQVAILNPEALCAAGVISIDDVDAMPQHLGDVEARARPADDFLRG